jgi:acetolactate synthase regulatory subunit
MSTSSQHSFSSVLSANPYKDTYFSGVSSFISESKAPEYSKDQFVISYLNTKEFITAQIAISKNIPDEDLFDAINNKAYDELALDQAVEYQIRYIETFNNLDEDNRHFHIFIVDPLYTTTTFEKVIEKVKYLDVIIPAPLLIKSLYAKEIIDSSGVHCFIYFQENDAFLTIYSNKDFIYTKSIKYSFFDMHERFCELYGERITFEDFMEFFCNANLKETDSEYKEYFIRLYKELFANVNDILTYAKRAFEIDKFEHVYVGTQIQTETKLHEMLEVELNIHSSEFNFNYEFETGDDVYLDQMHSLMHLYTLIPADERYECNFITYRRPPKFIRRESGKLIILTAAAFALAFAYPITYWILTYAQELQEDLLKQNYKEVHNIKITREATIKNRLADKEKALTLLAQEKKEYNDKKNTLIKIHEVKVDYPMKAKLIAAFTKDLNRFGVKVESINYEQKHDTKVLIFNLVSKKDRKITKLVEYLTKIHEGKFNFDLEEIKFDDKLQTYLSELKVTLS